MPEREIPPGRQTVAGVFENLFILLNFSLVAMLLLLWAFTTEPALLDLCKFFGGALVGQGVGQVSAVR